MSDLITRARKEWCEVHKSSEDAPDGEAWHYTLPCPPEVVAALLDVLREAQTDSIGSDGQLICFICGRDWEQAGLSWTPRHDTDCKLVAAEAAIARALEGK